MAAGKVAAARRPQAHVDRGRLPAREQQRPGQLEGEQLVGGGHQDGRLAAEPLQCELQVADRPVALLFGPGPVADQTGAEGRRLRLQVALQRRVEAVVGDDGDRFDESGAGEVVEQVGEDGTAADLDQRLRRIGEQRAHPGTMAGGKEDGIQGGAAAGSGAGRALGAAAAPLRRTLAPGSAGRGLAAGATRTGTTLNPSAA